MKIEQIDPVARTIAQQKRKELEDKFLRVKLKRCEKNVPLNPAWEQNWRDYINRAVRAAYIAYVSNPQQQTQNKRPTVP